MRLKVQRILEIFVLGHDGNLAPVHCNDSALQVLQLALHHLHVVSIAELVDGFLLVSRTDVNVQALRGLFESSQFV
jgi:hypothetical protein